MRLVVLFLVGIAAYILIRGLIQTLMGVQQRKQRRDTSRLQGTEMVQDPVCESYIPKDGALTEKIQGETYFFCSSECVREFKKSKLSKKTG
jgi:YHS domain-containing protein